jgi:hypothetical protein
MDEDDLPPKPAEDDEGFSGQLGWTFAGFAWVALFATIAGFILYGVMRWLA